MRLRTVLGVTLALVVGLGGGGFVLFGNHYAPLDEVAEIAIDVPESVPAGEPVSVVVTITNTTLRWVRLAHFDGALSFSVADADGERVWPSETIAVFPVERVLGLRPGESIEAARTWVQEDTDREAVPPGRYSIIGRFAATFHGSGRPYERIETAPVDLEIVASD